MTCQWRCDYCDYLYDEHKCGEACSFTPASPAQLAGSVGNSIAQADWNDFKRDFAQRCNNASPAAPRDTCEINSFTSGVCKFGTRSCVAEHAAPAQSVELVERLKKRYGNEYSVHSNYGATITHHVGFDKHPLIGEVVRYLVAPQPSLPAQAGEVEASITPYDRLTEELADEVARLCNDAPGSRNAVYAALANCNAHVVPAAVAQDEPLKQSAFMRDAAEYRKASQDFAMGRFVPMPPELRENDERENAAITACALMIKGICLTKPNAEWTGLIESRIRFMLKARAASPQSSPKDES